MRFMRWMALQTMDAFNGSDDLIPKYIEVCEFVDIFSQSIPFSLCKKKIIPKIGSNQFISLKLKSKTDKFNKIETDAVHSVDVWNKQKRIWHLWHLWNSTVRVPCHSHRHSHNKCSSVFFCVGITHHSNIYDCRVCVCIEKLESNAWKFHGFRCKGKTLRGTNERRTNQHNRIKFCCFHFPFFFSCRQNFLFVYLPIQCAHRVSQSVL